MSRDGYLSLDTIAAVATATGGAISVLRVSGPGAFAALASLGGDPGSPARKLVQARLRDSARQLDLDSALVVRFVGPESFTGEDVVELHLHGGSFVSTRVLEALARAGARQALPGEFSFRAVRNGKLDITQAQAIPDLIAAANDQAVSLALDKLSGAQSRMARTLAEDLRSLAAMGELGIDFSDQDVDELRLSALKTRLQPPLGELERLDQSYARGVRLQEGIRVAFAGPPNAGKSSFFNALVGEERSIVSEVAGTTRDVVSERLTLQADGHSITLRLADTAGLRATEDHVERMGIERTLRAAREAELLLFVVDGADPGALPAARTEWLALEQACGSELRERAIGILAKSDLTSSAAPAFGPSRWIETSAVTGHGVHDAVAEIVRFCDRLTARESGEILLTRADQAQSIQAALVHLNRALDAPELELFAADVRQALHALGPLIGETPADDVLGRVFSQFCIGK